MKALRPPNLAMRQVKCCRKPRRNGRNCTTIPVKNQTKRSLLRERRTKVTKSKPPNVNTIQEMGISFLQLKLNLLFFVTFAFHVIAKLGMTASIERSGSPQYVTSFHTTVSHATLPNTRLYKLPPLGLAQMNCNNKTFQILKWDSVINVFFPRHFNKLQWGWSQRITFSYVNLLSRCFANLVILLFVLFFGGKLAENLWKAQDALITRVIWCVE